MTTCKHRVGSDHAALPAGAAALAATLAALAASSGCVPSPKITITSVDVVEVGEQASELAIRLTLLNDADVPVKLDMWSYHLRAAGATYSGRWSAGITVPAMETVNASIPAVIPNSASPGPGCAWTSGGSVTYLAPSRLAEVLFELGLNRPSTGFSGAGPSMGTGGPVPEAP
ncbi:MAG: hypothetical protein FJ253_06095 [Phycisphaerae bacterium]|nr:hypothetical protein [Phycisphaerae bacterium]